MYKITFRKFLIIFIVSFIVAIIFGFYLTSQSLYDGFDYKFMKLFQENNVFLKNDISFFIVKSITFLGNTETYFIVGIPMMIYLLVKKEYKILKIILFSVIVAWLLNMCIKQIVSRTRPVEFWHIIEKSFSYPSGHAMVGSSFYITLGYIISEKRSKNYLCFFTFLAVIISLSRVVLGVHWLSDISVGFYLGYLCHCLSVKFFEEG